MDTQSVTRHHLDVPGGRVYYEVRGSGPLLLVVGQPMTSGPFAPLADLLAEDHTVVTYDPHGVGQSTVDDPSQDVTPEIEADDLAAIIDAVGGAPADVFGSSGGAVAGLALVVRHPEKVAHPHRPRAAGLRPAARRRAHPRRGRRHRGRLPGDGPGAGWGKFVALVMHDGPMTEAGAGRSPWPPAGQVAGTTARRPERRRLREGAGRRRDLLPPDAEAVHPLPAAGRRPPVRRPAHRRRRGREVRRGDRPPLLRGAGRTAGQRARPVPRRPRWLHGRSGRVRRRHPGGARPADGR